MQSRRSIYHYTNAAGLQGIIQDNGLRASGAYYLNDSSEIEHGCTLLQGVFREWLDPNAKSDSLPINVIRRLDSIFGRSQARSSRVSTIYVACLCEKGNLLSQWRAYGQAGGYSIEFTVRPSSLGIVSPGGFSDPVLRKVEYDERVQRKRLHKVLMASVETLEKPNTVALSAKLAPQEQEEFLQNVVLILYESLLDEIVTFKNPAFEEEQEWRLVVRPRLLAPVREPDTPHETPVKFRSSRGILVPYIELRPPKTEKLPINSIRYGPSLNPLRAESSLCSFLLVNGFSQDRISIDGCTTPVIL